MLINEVCTKCKLTKKAVEYYGKQGLITPVVMENGYRQFSDDDVIRLKKIAILRGLGLSVAEIRTTLEKGDMSPLNDILGRKEYEIEDLQAKQELIRQLSQLFCVFAIFWICQNKEKQELPKAYPCRSSCLFSNFSSPSASMRTS